MTPRNWAFWAIPFEKVSTLSSARSPRPTASSPDRARASASFRFSPFSWPKNARWSAAVIFWYMPRSSGRYPMRVRMASTLGEPKTSTEPASGPMMSRMIRSVVVFPAPFGPMSP